MYACIYTYRHVLQSICVHMGMSIVGLKCSCAGPGNMQEAKGWGEGKRGGEVGSIFSYTNRMRHVIQIWGGKKCLKLRKEKNTNL